MLGVYNDKTNPRLYRDAAEYATMEILRTVIAQLRERNIKPTARLLQAYRDNWMKNGRVMDFETMKATPLDFVNLLRMTGAKTFQGIPLYDVDSEMSQKLQDAITNKWTEAVSEYKESAKNGRYLHVITDPVIRSHVINHTNVNDSIHAKAVFYTENKSLREMNVGDSVVLLDRNRSEYRYEATVRESFPIVRENIEEFMDPYDESKPMLDPDGKPLQLGQVSQNQQNQNQQGFGNVPVGPQEENPTEIDVREETFMGWHGGVGENGKKYRGLAHVLGAYFTEADAKEIEKNIDPDMKFDGKFVQRSWALVRHLRSRGYDFKVGKSDHRNQIDVDLNVGNNLSLRVFDETNNGMFMGRLYDTYNSYYLQMRAPKQLVEEVELSPEDTLAILDYVTGNRKGRAQKYRTKETSFVQIDGLGPYIDIPQEAKEKYKEKTGKTYARDKMSIGMFVSPTKKRYHSIHFETVDEAETFIKTAIEDARKFVEEEFRAEELQALIDEGIDNETSTTDEFKARLEEIYSLDEAVRKAQEEAFENRYHSSEGGLVKVLAIRDSLVGSYEEGFNPSFVIDHMRKTDRGNERDAMMAALQKVGYDMEKIKGNEFGVNAIKERIVRFNPETAKSIDEIENEQLKSAVQLVRDTLKDSGVIGPLDENGRPQRDPVVLIDDKGVVRWEGHRQLNYDKKKDTSFDSRYELVSGEIGQIFVPDEHGIIKTNFEGENNYGFVPGYTGYFTFDGSYEDRMSRFRVKGFEQHLHEQLRATVYHQLTRPSVEVKEVGENGHLVTKKIIPSVFDGSALNGLYHGDVYGKRIDLDFMESSQLSQETKEAILKTLSNRVRFDNQYSDHATTSAETRAQYDYDSNDSSAFSYWKAAGETNMRVLGKDILDENGNKTGRVDVENYIDLTMTGTGKTQGLIWYLTDGATVNPDGTVTPSKGMINEKGELVPDKTALKKLPYFKYEEFNAWDRTQMSANQLMTALRVDENVNTALITFGGWTFDDSYAVSKEFAERNKIFGEEPNEESRQVLEDLIRKLSEYEQETGELDDKTLTAFKEDTLKDTGMMWTNSVIREGIRIHQADLDEDVSFDEFLDTHGRFRPLQRGDKISDFGGNKGTIGIVIDRNMSEEEAKRLKLEKEVRFLKANPELDVIGAPYSMLSRHNAGVVKELMDGEPKDLIDPDTGEIYKAAMGKLNIIITDMQVDKKTHAYSREDVLEGKGRKASGQLAWAIQAKNAVGIMNEIYGRNDVAWSTLREYLIVTGLDMKADGTLVKGYEPHPNENRREFEYDPNVSSEDFLNQIKKQGGFLKLPFDVEFKTGAKTDAVPVLSASLRQNVELIDGTMRRNDFTNQYMKIYDAVGEFMNANSEEGRIKAQKKAQNYFDRIQQTIIDRQFNGGHNGKHSFIREKIMGKRMDESATGVAIVDPRLKIGEVAMNKKMMDALNVEEGETIMMFRDPVLRDGAIRSMKVVYDETAHGLAFNPITDKSHDGDFDGDTYGAFHLKSEHALEDLENKFSHWANMIEDGSGFDDLYFQSGMDLASGEAVAREKGDKRPEKLMKRVKENANSNNPRLKKKACRDLSEYAQIVLREHGFGSAYISLENDKTVYESLKKMVEDGAKGSMSKLEEYMEYHNGKKTMIDARDIQYATGVKTDDTGLAGAFSQKLVSVLRNQNIKSALEVTYPATQGTLQIKHDAAHARTTNGILANDLNRTFNGLPLEVDEQGEEFQLTPEGFVKQLKDVYSRLKVDVADKHIYTVAEGLSEYGQMLTLQKAMEIKGAPMDQVAYGGGFKKLVSLANQKRSLLEGAQNKLFAPFKMRYANEKTRLVKKDTQWTAEEQAEQARQRAERENSDEYEQLSLFDMDAEPELSL